MTPDYQRPAGSWQIRLIQVFVVIVAIILVFVGLTSVARNLASGISNESTATVAIEAGVEVAFRVAPGSTASQVASNLIAAGVISNTNEFESAIQDRRVADQLKAGDYVLVTGAEIDLLIDTLVEGPGPADVFPVTVIEGLTID